MMYFCFFFVNDTATTEIYTSVHTLSLHDALPIFYAAYAGDLEQMFQQRYRVFKQRLGWSVADCDGAERDAFDEASPIYLLAYNSEGRLAGSWRFLPTTGPYMLRDVFPALLHGEAAPEHPQIWEEIGRAHV